MRAPRSRSGGLTHRPGASASLRKLADEELMALVQQGDADAFEIVYDRHCDAAFSLAYRMCGRRASAEDVMQEAFLALWRSGGRYDHTRGSLRNWILRITHNRAVDTLRRGVVRGSHLFHEEGVLERIPGPERTEEQALASEQAQEVQGALRALPREQSRVVELAYFGGFTHTEIAAMLHMPVGTVKGRMRLGLAKLRLTLDNEQGVAQ